MLRFGKSYIHEIKQLSFPAPSKLDAPKMRIPGSPNLPKVLLVEDNLINQKVATLMLSQVGFNVDIACDGEQAVEMALKNQYPIIFMDCQLPVKDGYQATREIRERLGNQIPIIAMTANAMQGDKQKCLDAGMSDYISKPVEMEKLRIAVQKALQ